MATEFVGWRKDCKTTIRSTYQVLSRGTPNLENETWGASANVLNGPRLPKPRARGCRRASIAGTSPRSKRCVSSLLRTDRPLDGGRSGGGRGTTPNTTPLVIPRLGLAMAELAGPA